uniref:Uncharacterized protein LOC114341640 n=1 Tax=Diabrotica virgifera virgifera TaxID=50390 RepID=A0A6P7GF57_DIAVI
MKSMCVVLLSLISLALVAGDYPDYYTTSSEYYPVASTSIPGIMTTVTATTSIGEDVVYVQDRQVPDPSYEIDAVEAFKEAKALHPGVDGTQLLETFSKLFNAKHTVKGGWKVVENLGPLYNPDEDYIYIELIVKDAKNSMEFGRTVRIFNSRNEQI